MSSYTERCVNRHPVATHFVGLTISCGPLRAQVFSSGLHPASLYISVDFGYLPEYRAPTTVLFALSKRSRALNPMNGSGKGNPVALRYHLASPKGTTISSR